MNQIYLFVYDSRQTKLLMKLGLHISHCNLTQFINPIQIRFQINILSILECSFDDYYQILSKHDYDATGETRCKKYITSGLIQNYKLSLTWIQRRVCGNYKAIIVGALLEFQYQFKPESTQATRLNCSTVTLRHILNAGYQTFVLCVFTIRKTPRLYGAIINKNKQINRDKQFTSELLDNV